MRDTMIIALEASWELDPVLLEGPLWKRVEDDRTSTDEIGYECMGVAHSLHKEPEKRIISSIKK